MLRVVAVAILGLVSTAAVGQPTFSIEAFDPTIGAPDAFGGVPISEGDILSSPVPGPPLGTPAPGPFLLPPGISIPVGALGLLPVPGVPLEVDALSYGHDFIPVPFNFAGGLPETWYFSVDSFAAGDGLPVFPGNVTTEGAFGAVEASADIYTTLPMPPGPLFPAPFASSNVGFLDGDGVFPFGAPGYGLLEPNPPGSYLGDNLDAVDVDTTLADISGAPVYFSLDSAFPDPLGLGNTGTAAANGFVGGDVLVSVGGAIVPYAPAPVLGLDVAAGFKDSDDLDALATFDVDGDLIYTPGVDTLFFSVRRGSAVIGAPDSMFGAPIEEGDILIDPLSAAFLGGVGGPFPGIFIAAEWLGLGTIRSGTAGAFGPFGDDLNALDVLAIPEPATCMLMLIGLGAVVASRQRSTGMY